MRFVNIGFGNVVNISKIVSVVSPAASMAARRVRSLRRMYIAESVIS